MRMFCVLYLSSVFRFVIAMKMILITLQKRFKILDASLKFIVHADCLKFEAAASNFVCNSHFFRLRNYRSNGFTIAINTAAINRFIDERKLSHTKSKWKRQNNQIKS